MNTGRLPTPGMYLLPVQGFHVAYCLQVEDVLDCEDWGPGMKQLACKRWGLDEQGQPFDDGHHNKSYYTDVFIPVGQHAWRASLDRAFTGLPVYFKQINFNPKGQLEMFQ